MAGGRDHVRTGDRAVPREHRGPRSKPERLHPASWPTKRVGRRAGRRPATWPQAATVDRSTLYRISIKDHIDVAGARRRRPHRRVPDGQRCHSTTRRLDRRTLRDGRRRHRVGKTEPPRARPRHDQARIRRSAPARNPYRHRPIARRIQRRRSRQASPPSMALAGRRHADTRGSIRIPAAACGVVGLEPSLRRHLDRRPHSRSSQHRSAPRRPADANCVRRRVHRSTERSRANRGPVHAAGARTGQATHVAWPCRRRYFLDIVDE